MEGKKFKQTWRVRGVLINSIGNTGPTKLDSEDQG
jgi:hypothetical protein